VADQTTTTASSNFVALSVVNIRRHWAYPPLHATLGRSVCGTTRSIAKAHCHRRFQMSSALVEKEKRLRSQRTAETSERHCEHRDLYPPRLLYGETQHQLFNDVGHDKRRLRSTSLQLPTSADVGNERLPPIPNNLSRQGPYL